MTKKLDVARLNQLKTDAYENIESYNDPETPKALAQFTGKMKTILMADPEMLESLPEYLPVALFGRVKFSKEAKLKWSHWINTKTMPAWDDFKVTVAFSNDDLPLVKKIRDYSQDLLIEACAVLYLLETQGNGPARSAKDADGREDEEHGEEDYDDRDQAQDDYEGRDEDDEDGYDDQYDEVRFKGEDR